MILLGSGMPHNHACALDSGDVKLNESVNQGMSIVPFDCRVLYPSLQKIIWPFEIMIANCVQASLDQ